MQTGAANYIIVTATESNGNTTTTTRSIDHREAMRNKVVIIKYLTTHVSNGWDVVLPKRSASVVQ